MMMVVGFVSEKKKNYVLQNVFCFGSFSFFFISFFF